VKAFSRLREFASRWIWRFDRPWGPAGRKLARSMNTSHASVTEWGLSHLSISADDILLDVGCGGGATVARLSSRAPEGTVIGLDLSRACVSEARKLNREQIRAGRVDILQGSVSSIPFPKDTFHGVTAVETHYFWPDWEKGLQEIFRVIRPGGWISLICTAYRGSEFDERNLRWVRTYNMRYLSPEEFRDSLSGSGFDFIQIECKLEKGWLSAKGLKPL